MMRNLVVTRTRPRLAPSGVGAFKTFAGLDPRHRRITVLDRFSVNPILPAQDGDRARAFYRDVLGLQLVSGPNDDPIMFRAGSDTSIVISEIPDRIPPPYPVVSFTVERIEELVDALKARGATFQPLASSASFAGQEGSRDGEVMDFGPVKSAFLQDSEGNLLALNEIIG